MSDEARWRRFLDRFLLRDEKDQKTSTDEAFGESHGSVSTFNRDQEAMAVLLLIGDPRVMGDTELKQEIKEVLPQVRRRRSKRHSSHSETRDTWTPTADHVNRVQVRILVLARHVIPLIIDPHNQDLLERYQQHAPGSPLWGQVSIGTVKADVPEALKRDIDESKGPVVSTYHQGAELRTLLLRWPPERAESANPYDFGVFASDVARRLYPDTAPPYVPRTIDAALTAALDQRPPLVIIVGPAKAGKSRTAFEAIKRAMPDAIMVMPRGSHAVLPMLDVIEALPPGGRYVIWMDELARFFLDPPLAVADIDRWARLPMPVVAIGTLTSREQQLLGAARYPLARLVFEHVRRAGHEFWLDAEFSGDEAAIANRLYPSIPRHLAEHLAAVDELMLKLEHGKEVRPEGFALVRAAVALRATSWIVNHQRPMLLSVWHYYMQRFAPSLSLTESVLARAIEWATEPVSSSAALLTRKTMRDDPSFEATFSRARDAIDKGWENVFRALLPYKPGELNFMTANDQMSAASPAELRIWLDRVYETMRRTPTFEVMDLIVEQAEARWPFVDDMRIMFDFLPEQLRAVIDWSPPDAKATDPSMRAQLVLTAMMDMVGSRSYAMTNWL